MLLQEPPRSEGDLNFALFGIPVRVHPMFWVLTLLLGLHHRDPVALLTWIIAAFVSILVHELGHAAMFRVHGYYPSVLLYGMGGLTFPGPGTFGSRNPDSASQVLISAAGPGAQFALVAVLYAVLRLARYEVAVITDFPFLCMPYLEEVVFSQGFSHFINQIFLISVFWGLFNLLPIYPMDGGQIAREFLQHFFPRHGLRSSLVLSAFTATFLAIVAAVQWHAWWTAAFLAYMAFGSLQALAAYGRGPW